MKHLEVSDTDFSSSSPRSNKMPVKYNRPIQGLKLLILFTFLNISLYKLNHVSKAGDIVVDHYKDVLTKLPKAMSKKTERSRPAQSRRTDAPPIGYKFHSDT
ncbi:hypothetical protein N7G274_007808 [Stereocaulon virgatum]|uniref:Uncharacterized protein n=1 Tax=Stereocaulon virgatum TaxID=373712 RepID=A0ABR4A2L4_9LECA